MKNPHSSWAGPTDALATEVALDNERYRLSRAELPENIANDFRQEREGHEGDYRRRQIFELVQNGADAINDDPALEAGAVHVVLTPDGLYCANEGAPFTAAGLLSLRLQLWSSKSGNQIGRFGRGFKSILALTDAPRIFSRSGSFAFGRLETARFLRENARIRPEHVGGNGRPEVSVLAYAQPLDPAAAAEADDVLAELMGWATTVIHIPFTDDSRFAAFSAAQRFAQLELDIRQFQPHFLIFAKHVESLVMEIRGQASMKSEYKAKVVPLGHDGSASDAQVYTCAVSSNGSSPDTWTLFEFPPVSIEEGIDGSSINRRRDDDGKLLSVPMAWAVPSSSAGLGYFWNFFPTRSDISLRGVLNAPWDTNSERTALLEESGYNKRLIDAAAKQVVSVLAYLSKSTPDDPGAYLEMLPARGREERNTLATLLATRVNALAADCPSLPDLDGAMRRPSDIRRPPENVPVAILDQWAATPRAPRNFLHPSAADPARHIRLGRARLYMEAAGAGDLVTVAQWLELLVDVEDPESSIRAIGLAAMMAEHSALLRDEVCRARIVLTVNRELVVLDPARANLPSPGPAQAGVVVVHPAVAGDPASLKTLSEIFSFKVVDDSTQLEHFVLDLPAEPSDSDWERLWLLAGSVDAQAAIQVIRTSPQTANFRVRTTSGLWRRARDVLLVGEIIVDSLTDPEHTLDREYHHATIEVLQGLGMSDVPSLTGGDGDWIDAYRDFTSANLERELRPNLVENLLARLPESPTHLRLLGELSDAASARLCHWLLQRQEVLEPWTTPGLPRPLERPALWHIRSSGHLPTSRGPRLARDTVAGPLALFGRVIPVASVSAEIADRLGLPTSFESLPQHILLQACGALENEHDDTVIGAVLAAACRCCPAPASIRCRMAKSLTSLQPSSVVAVSEPRLFDALAQISVGAVLVPTEQDVLNLSEKWGLRDRSTLAETFDYDLSEECGLLADSYLMLGEMHGRKLRNLRFARCSRIERVISTDEGSTRSSTNWGIENEVLLVLDSDRPDAVLVAASEALELGLSVSDIALIIDNEVRAEIEVLLARVRAQPDDIERVKVLFSLASLRKSLPAALINELGAQADDLNDIARAALAVHGTQLLSQLRSDLAERGIPVPRDWGGSRAAVEFVRELGFDTAFAGFQRGDRTAQIRVPGPVQLNDLHDYQRDLCEDVKELVRRSRPTKAGGWRGLLFLPTGSGKTRVGVQAVLEMIEHGEFETPESLAIGDRLVLWIAQTDELCEQAVQAFSEVWGAIGTSGELSIGRLWGSNRVEWAGASNEPFRAQIVVATISKLTAAALDQPSYEWLRSARFVIADEAHQADSPEYTRVLKWMGTGVRPGKGQEDKRPLLGLTATPFKTGEAATKRLQSRFGRRLLQIVPPPGANLADWSVTRFLREQKVLAEARHVILDGMDVVMADNEATEFLGKGGERPAAWLPAAVEGRIALDRERNARLLNSIESLPDDWPVIVFAISVEHAQVLAALLQLRGVSAATVSSGTSAGARHHYSRQFREKKLRVITNYGVLTTGFDAPETRAIYIARPTFSQSLYMQMIGRGLRGQRNGGTEECLIVDVRDNIERFGGAFAYDEVGHIWSDSKSEDLSAEEWMGHPGDEYVEDLE